MPSIPPDRDASQRIAFEGDMAALNILLISVVCMFAGASSFCVILSGIGFAPCALLFLAFGWCYLIPLYCLVGLNWLFYRRHASLTPGPASFVLFGALFGAGLMALCGWEASTWQVYNGMVLGGAVAGAVANLLIVTLKDKVPRSGHLEEHLRIPHA